MLQYLKRGRRLRTGFFWGVLALLAGVSCINASSMFVAAEEQKVQAIPQAPDSGNGLPNISARFKPYSTSVDVFADLLVWKAEESGSETWAEVITSSGATTHCDVRDVRFGWDAGFRLGLGYGMRRDQWDTQLYYTWFRTRGRVYGSVRWSNSSKINASATRRHRAKFYRVV